MRTELDVPFSHKEEAKALGAKWDRTKKIWYVPSGVNPEPFAEWLPGVDRSDPSAPYIYLVLGKRECWKCHKETSVAAFGIPYRTDSDESIAIAHAPNEAGHIAIDTANANAARQPLSVRRALVPVCPHCHQQAAGTGVCACRSCRRLWRPGHAHQF